MAALEVSDVELARRLQLSRQAIHARRTGRTAMTADDLADVADALDVDVAILLGPPHEALRWLADHRADELDGQAPGKTEWANSSGDQDEHRAITHRRPGFPCNHPVVPRRHGRLTSRAHLPHPPLPTCR